MLTVGDRCFVASCMVQWVAENTAARTWPRAEIRVETGAFGPETVTITRRVVVRRVGAEDVVVSGSRTWDVESTYQVHEPRSMLFIDLDAMHQDLAARVKVLSFDPPGDDVP